MRFETALSLAALTLGVIAEPVIVGRGTPVERDVPAITNVLNAVGSGLTALDSAVKSFSGDASAIDSSAAALIATINTQAATVPGTGALTVADAIGLAGPVQALQALGQTLVDDLIAKKSAFEAAGLCSDLNSITSGIQSSSTSLINAIVALVPDTVQTVAQQLAAPFVASLAQGSSAYAPGSCVDATTNPSTTAATASTTPAASSSTPAATAPGTPSSSQSASSGVAVPSSTAAGSSSSTGSSPVPSATHATSPVAGTGTTPKPSSSTTAAPPTFTGAGHMNSVANSFGVIAIAVAAFAL